MGGKKLGNDDGYTVVSPGLNLNLVLVPQEFRCRSSGVRQCSRAKNEDKKTYKNKNKIKSMHLPSS